MISPTYAEILVRLDALDRKRERLENTLCVCGHEWHQHAQCRGDSSCVCEYRACACEWFVAAV